VPRPGPDPTDRSRSLTGAEEKVAHNAIDAARALLTGACLDFIKANSQYDPLKVLDDLQRGGGFQYRDRSNAAGEIKHGGRGSSDTIFLTNSFFNPGQTYFFLKGSNIVLDVAGFQQEVVLHELRHALIGRHPIGGSSEDYDRGIRENCFKQPEGGSQ